ncbi:MAG: hypothetical protein M3Y33_06130, partial [Actinomycetota bacterium]|nr:hypothetical protein [Actinomycetota bacterium]
MTNDYDQAAGSNAARARQPYGDDAARFITDYPDFRLFRPGHLHGWGARADVGGRLVGDLITDASLDGLAARLDRA